MTLFAFRGVKSHEWTFYDTVKIVPEITRFEHQVKGYLMKVVSPPESQGTSKRTLLAIDDAENILSLITDGLSSENYIIVTCTDCQQAIEVLEGGTSPDLILLDLMLPDMSGLDFLDVLNTRYPHLKTIVISAKDDVETVTKAMRQGALDYILKPFSVAELRISVNKAIHYKETEDELRRLQRQQLYSEDYSLLYASSEMANIMETILKVASTNMPVLITGDSGVGKEVVARELHQRSHWASGPFLKINCAALPTSLLESELFGYDKGAFTGAMKSKPSKFESASGGTLFLDEIGELEPHIQAKFLHVLQDGTFNRLGSNKLLKTDARIIVATNQNLEENIKKGTFRSDLYYRLNVARIHIPPLRERRVDIALLTNYFLVFYTRQYKRSVDLDEETLSKLYSHPWPGNVRELQNVLRRYIVLGRLEFDRSGIPPDFTNEQTPFNINTTEVFTTPSGSEEEQPEYPNEQPVKIPVEGTLSLKEIAKSAARKAEKEAILIALDVTGWNKSRAAKLLKISYKAFLYKMKDCGIVTKPNTGNYLPT
ncbi:MAG: sigma-54 dependent transcriptional regulator [bacterium]